MAGTDDVVWLVGRCEELGLLEQQLASADATIEETWPADTNSGIVALLRVAADATDAVSGALDHVRRFESETDGRSAAQEVAGSA